MQKIDKNPLHDDPEKQNPLLVANTGQLESGFEMHRMNDDKRSSIPNNAEAIMSTGLLQRGYEKRPTYDKRRSNIRASLKGSNDVIAIQKEFGHRFADEYFSRKKAMEETQVIVDKLYERGSEAHPEIVDDLERSENSVYGSVRRMAINCKNYIIDSIPYPELLLLKQDHPKLFYVLSFIAYGFTLGLFLYFFVNGIIAGNFSLGT